MGWVHRDGDAPAIEATEKGGDELQTRGIKQEGAFPSRSAPLEQGTNGPSLTIQLRIGQMGFLFFAVDQISISPPFRLPERSPAEEFDQRGRLRGRSKKAMGTVWHPSGLQERASSFHSSANAAGRLPP